MPLSDTGERREIHSRVIEMRTFARPDGRYEAEAHLVDRKTFDFIRVGATDTVRAGEPFHDLWIRLTVDSHFVVVAIEAASDVTPWAVCKEAEQSLQVLVGQALERGWTSQVRGRLRGAASCTHLPAMLIPLATTAVQGIYGLRSEEDRGASIGSLVDSCHAFDRSGEVVRRVAPMHYQPRQAA